MKHDVCTILLVYLVFNLILKLNKKMCQNKYFMLLCKSLWAHHTFSHLLRFF